MEKKPLGFLLSAGAPRPPVPILSDGLTTLGRDEGNKIVLDDLAASREHAIIEGRQGAIFITDLDSSNGTFVDDIRLTANAKTHLTSGQEVRIGGKLFYLVSADSPLEGKKLVLSKAGAFSKKTTLGPVNIDTTPHEVAGAAPVPKPREVPVNIRLKPKPEPTQKAAVIPTDIAFEHTLAGEIGAGGLPQILQMIHTKHFSGSLKVTADKFSGTILFVNGDFYAGFAAREHGTAAVYACAAVKNARFTFDKLDVSAVQITPRNITLGSMQILMECCCIMHEADSK